MTHLTTNAASLTNTPSATSVSPLGSQDSPKDKFLNSEELEAEFKLSAKTSIYRSDVSAPLALLLKSGCVPEQASCLNFGKGKYDLDSRAIRKHSGHCIDYDYTYARTDIFGSHFAFVYAGYVINTLPIFARNVVWSELAHVTSLDGVCYVAARSDRVKGVPFEDGIRTKKLRTFQKSYKKGELEQEALKFFRFAQEIRAGSGFRIVECRHQ